MCRPADATLYACRPGLRLWRATIDGSVTSTIMFRDLVNAHKQSIILLSSSLATTQSETSSTERQFGPVLIYCDDMIVTWDVNAVYVLDPKHNALIGQHECLGQIVDVSTNDEEVFILRTGAARNVIRLGVRPEKPPVVAPGEWKKRRGNEDPALRILSYRDSRVWTLPRGSTGFMVASGGVLSEWYG